MTPLSRRAFVTAGAASLLVGCGGGNGNPQPGPAVPDGPSGSTPATSSSRSDAAGASASSPAGQEAHALRRSLPVGLRIPDIGVDTPVMRLGLAADGTVEVPPAKPNDRAGWYRHSPTPGQVGPSIILGHVTVGAGEDGVFRHLARLREGDPIMARLESGAVPVFAVSSVRTVAKAEFPAEDVYGDVNRPELRLITCGGPRTDDGYRDNVIVFATLRSTRHS